MAASHLFVAGLADEVDEGILKGAFVPFGPVAGVELPIEPGTQKHRGFGFVEFEDPDDAAEAMDNMHMAELYGAVLKVRVARPDKRSAGAGAGPGGSAGARAVWEDESYIKNYLMDPNAHAPPASNTPAADPSTADPSTADPPAADPPAPAVDL